MAESEEELIGVQAIVSHRDHEPYVQITKGKELFAQLTMSQARGIAHDIIIAASRAEADAVLVRYFRLRDLPTQALRELLMDFRDFRLGLDLASRKLTFDEGGDATEGAAGEGQPDGRK